MRLMSADVEDKGILSLRVRLDTLADHKNACRIVTAVERGQKVDAEVPVHIAVSIAST